MYGYGYGYSTTPLYALAFDPLNINGLSLYLNKNTNVNTKVAADFVAANSEYLSSASVDFDKGNEDFSVGCWVKFDALSGFNEQVMGKWDVAAAQMAYTLFYNTAGSNTIKFSISSDGSSFTALADSGLTPSLGVWYFVVGVHDSVNDLVKISVNGGDFGTASHSGGVFASTENFKINDWIGGDAVSRFFSGQVDAPFFFDKALTLSEINALYNTNSGVDYPSLTDLNGTQYAIGQALDGTTDAFNIDSVLTPLASTTTGEWELYYTPVTAVSVELLLAFGDTNLNNYLGVANINGKCRIGLYHLGTTVSECITDSVVFSNSTQEKINIIQDGVDFTILIDGVEVAQTKIGTAQGSWFNDYPLLDNGRLGCLNFNSAGNSNFADGTIQNVKIWSDATQTTLVANYLMNDVEGANQIDSANSYDAIPIGTPVSTLASVNNTTITTIESSLVSWWRLNETSGTRYDSVLASANDLVDVNTVGYSLGKVQEISESGELVWNWVDMSANSYIFKNDVVTKQPLLTANSIDFDGVDDSLNCVTSQPLNDLSGIFFFSGYFDNTQLNVIFNTADNATINDIINIRFQTTGEFAMQVKVSAINNVITGTTQLVNGSYYYGYIKSTGTAYEINLNGAVDTIASGTNNGNWFGDCLNRDEMSIGNIKNTAESFWKAKSNKIIYSNDHTIDTAPILNFMSNPNN